MNTPTPDEEAQTAEERAQGIAAMQAALPLGWSVVDKNGMIYVLDPYDQWLWQMELPPSDPGRLIDLRTEIWAQHDSGLRSGLYTLPETQAATPTPEHTTPPAPESEAAAKPEGRQHSVSRKRQPSPAWAFVATWVTIAAAVLSSLMPSFIRGFVGGEAPDELLVRKTRLTVEGKWFFSRPFRCCLTIMRVASGGRNDQSRRHRESMWPLCLGAVALCTLLQAVAYLFDIEAVMNLEALPS